MEIAQKKFSNKTKFEFRDEDLKYTVQDKSGSQSFSVEYGAIPTDHGDLVERNDWYRNAGVLWFVLGVFIIVSHYLETGTMKWSIWLPVGAICFVMYWVVKTAYVVIDTEKGRLFIIKDEKHDEILKEIDSRRKGQWLSWYGALDLGNDPSNEINKFKWLLDKEVISQEEYNLNIAQITNHHNVELADLQNDEMGQEGRVIN